MLRPFPFITAQRYHLPISLNNVVLAATTSLACQEAVGTKPEQDGFTMIQLSFAQVEAVLAAANDIASHKRTAFAGRLKFLMKNGVPEREAPGRGKAGGFSVDQFLELGLAVELLQAGLTPQVAARLVKDNWFRLRDDVMGVVLLYEEAVRSGSMRARISLPWAWLAPLSELEDLTSKKLSPLYRSIRACNFRVLAKGYEKGSDLLPHARCVAIDAGELLSNLLINLTVQFCFVDLASVISDLEKVEKYLRLSGEIINHEEFSADSERSERALPPQILAEITSANETGADLPTLRGLARFALLTISREQWRAFEPCFDELIPTGQITSSDAVSGALEPFVERKLLTSTPDKLAFKLTRVGLHMAQLYTAFERDDHVDPQA